MQTPVGCWAFLVCAGGRGGGVYMRARIWWFGSDLQCRWRVY